MLLAHEVFRCCMRKETPVSSQMSSRTGVANEIGKVSSTSVENAASHARIFNHPVMPRNVDDFLRDAINAGILVDTLIETPRVKPSPLPRTTSAAVSVAPVAARRTVVCGHAADVIVHKPAVRARASHVVLTHAAAATLSAHCRRVSSKPAADGTMATVHRNSSWLRRPEFEAAIKIQQAWRNWQARVQTLIANAPEGEKFVFTQSLGPPLSDGADKLLTVHAIPVHGKGPVLSMYSRPPKLLGQGSYAGVAMGPRGYICRMSRQDAALPPMSVDAAQFADLKSFVACVRVTNMIDIGRYAGQDIYEHLSKRSDALPIGIFKTASADLKSLHERGLFHMDIKLNNMTYLRKPSGEKIISFIDCDRITNAPTYLPTLCRGIISSDQHSMKYFATKADDEFSFLFSLMAVADSAFMPIYLSGGTRLTEEKMDGLRRNARIFVQKYILPEYRNDVLRFITMPVKKNFLSVALHDTFDWNAPPDLVSVMQQGDLGLLKKSGAVMFSSAATPAQKRDFLLAQDADSVPGLYWAVKAGTGGRMHQAWLELFWQLPIEEQIGLREKLFTLPDEAGANGWFYASMAPCRAPGSGKES
jgi:hypothetical protein